jgi:hypothetical protein
VAGGQYAAARLAATVGLLTDRGRPSHYPGAMARLGPPTTAPAVGDRSSASASASGGRRLPALAQWLGRRSSLVLLTLLPLLMAALFVAASVRADAWGTSRATYV